MAFLNRKETRARRDYICDICGKIINNKQMHLFLNGRDDKGFIRERHHLTCNEIFNSYQDVSEFNEEDYDFIENHLINEYCSKCQYYTGKFCILGRSVFLCDIGGLKELPQKEN